MECDLIDMKLENGDFLIGNGRVAMLLEKDWDVGGWGPYQLWATIDKECEIVLRAPSGRTLGLHLPPAKCVAVDPTKLIAKFEFPLRQYEPPADKVNDLLLSAAELARCHPMMSVSDHAPQDVLIGRALACRLLEDSSAIGETDLPEAAILIFRKALADGHVTTLSDQSITLSKEYLQRQIDIRLKRDAKSQYLNSVSGINGRCHGVIFGALIGSALGSLTGKQKKLPTSRECKAALEGEALLDFESMLFLSEKFARSMYALARDEVVGCNLNCPAQWPSAVHSVRSQSGTTPPNLWEGGGVAQAISLGLICCLKSPEETIQFLRELKQIKIDTLEDRSLLTAYVLAIRHLILTQGTNQELCVLEIVREYLISCGSEAANLLSEDSIGLLKQVRGRYTEEVYDFCLVFSQFSNGYTFHQGLYESLRSDTTSQNVLCLLGGLLGAAKGISHIPKKLRISVSSVLRPPGDDGGNLYSSGLMDQIQRFLETLHESNLARWGSEAS